MNSKRLSKSKIDYPIANKNELLGKFSAIISLNRLDCEDGILS